MHVLNNLNKITRFGQYISASKEQSSLTASAASRLFALLRARRTSNAILLRNVVCDVAWRQSMRASVNIIDTLHQWGSTNIILNELLNCTRRALYDFCLQSVHKLHYALKSVILTSLKHRAGLWKTISHHPSRQGRHEMSQVIKNIHPFQR